jgi:hypothetical protein
LDGGGDRGNSGDRLFPSVVGRGIRGN